VKSYVITLTSQQILGNPDLLNSYLFEDPVFGTDINWPIIAECDNSGHNNFINNGGYTVLRDGGLFVPWGYIFQNTVSFLTAGPFKGPYTITFSPTALDTQYYANLKIVYDFGDGQVQSVERSVLQNSNVELATLNSGPAGINIPHEYWPQNTSVTTYYPSISVLNGNLAQNIYHFTLTFVPVSLFEFTNFHLLNTAQHSKAVDETFSVFELDAPEYVTNARFFSAGTTEYNDPTALPTVDFNTIPGLVLNLDASDTLTLIRDNTERVSYWRDKSDFNNDFSQSIPELTPIFNYNTVSQSQKKAVVFNRLASSGNNEFAPYMTCVNTNSGFNLMQSTSGYTAFYITKANTVDGTIFNGGISQTTPNNLLFEFINPYGFAVYQGTSGVRLPNVSYVLPGYNIYTITAQTSGSLDITADNQSFNFKKLNFIQFGDTQTPPTLGLPTNPPGTSFEVSQVLIYNRVLNQDEYNLVYSSLISRWGITPRND